MTHDEIINMAREAGLSITPSRSGQYDGGRIGCDVVGLKRFAALVAAHQAGIEGAKVAGQGVRGQT